MEKNTSIENYNSRKQSLEMVSMLSLGQLLTGLEVRSWGKIIMATSWGVCFRLLKQCTQYFKLRCRLLKHLTGKHRQRQRAPGGGPFEWAPTSPVMLKGCHFWEPQDRIIWWTTSILSFLEWECGFYSGTLSSTGCNCRFCGSFKMDF